MSIVGAGAHLTPRQSTGSDGGVHLAVRPHCGPLSGSPSDVNAGIDLHTIKTIVSFGVSVPLIIVCSIASYILHLMV